MIGDGTVIPSKNTLDGPWLSMSETVHFPIKIRCEKHCFIMVLAQKYRPIIRGLSGGNQPESGII
jgi:hypothetical protein